jgi:hypothetical protein
MNKNESVKMTPAKKNHKLRRCLNPNCHKEAKTVRGLCLSCYGAASRLVRIGKTTWGTLEANGKILPVVKGGITGWLLDDKKIRKRKTAVAA